MLSSASHIVDHRAGNSGALESVQGQLIPNLFIGGAQKSGTSTLYAWLADHSQCLMSQPKEPMFFNRHEQVSAVDGYAKCFSSDKKSERFRVIGEASTTYLSFPDVPERICDGIGRHPKFVFVLRNPAERAVSAYWHMAKRFHECRSLADVFETQAGCLQEAIADENQSIHLAENNGTIATAGYDTSVGDRYWSFRYLRNSCYMNDLKRFENAFGADHLLILLTDDLAQRPVETFRRVADFLGIDDSPVPPSVGTRQNVTRVPPQTSIMRFLVGTMRHSPDSVSRILRRLMATVSHSAPAAPEAVTQTLERLFLPHNERLSAYLDRDLSGWLPEVC